MKKRDSITYGEEVQPLYILCKLAPFASKTHFYDDVDHKLFIGAPDRPFGRKEAMEGRWSPTTWSGRPRRMQGGD